MENELRILMLEDLEEDAGLIDWTLNKEKIVFTRRRVDTREDFIEALGEFNPTIILSDHALPQFNSLEALEICKQKKIKVPFILVTGAVSEEFAVNCLKQGADDYVLKSNLARLPMAIRHSIRQHKYETNQMKQEEMLRKQNEELVKINKELDSFVYSVSHNLRSPLSSVLGLVNVARLEVEQSKETTDHYFKLIEGSVLKLDKTLREILDYSLNVRTDLEIGEVNLEKLILECFEQLKYLKGHDGINLQVKVKKDRPFYSDYHRLSIIFNNLITNAIRYSDRSKNSQQITIEASIHHTSAKVTIRDNGIGIAPEHLSNVFNMFFRATERSDGAGLGLYIVKEMIGKLKGAIAITSTPHEETWVTFTIPNKILPI